VFETGGPGLGDASLDHTAATDGSGDTGATTGDAGIGFPDRSGGPGDCGGGDKTRWIYLPPGQKIDTTDMDEWTFPVGTKIFKEFSLPQGDASPGTRIETRLLWKHAPKTWYRTTYAW